MLKGQIITINDEDYEVLEIKESILGKIFKVEKDDEIFYFELDEEEGNFEETTEENFNLIEVYDELDENEEY